MAVLRNLEDDSHVQTRLSQYEAINNKKGIGIAKQFLLSKLEGQNKVLKKYGLKTLETVSIKREIESVTSEDLKVYRRRLTQIEGKCSRLYFKEIFKIFPESIRPENRRTYKAYDGLNNVFNFGYYILKCRVHKALLRAKLEPYLGFLHSVQFGKPSLVCDFQELYRHLIDDYIIERCHALRKKDFVLVTDFMMHLKMGKKVHLCEFEADSLAEGLNSLFDRIVDVARIKHGNRQTIDTLINEEALLFAKYLRGEKKDWIPRIVNQAYYDKSSLSTNVG